jgi:recombinational DNA repair protein RecT
MSTVIERDVAEERKRWMAILRDKNAPDGEILRAKVGIIETAREQIEDATASGVDGKVIVDYAIQLLREDPKILPCTVSSLVTSISRGAMCGLKLGGLRPEAYIVPVPLRKKVGRDGNIITGSAKTVEATPGDWMIVRTDASLWPSYHGWIKLVRNTGRLLRDPLVMVVYEGEEFAADFEDGVLVCKHKGSALNPARRAGDDGKIIYVWSRWFLDTGSVDVLLSREEIEAHKKQYSKKPKYGEWNWDTKWREMAEKTVIIHSVRRRFVPMQTEAQGLGLLDEATADEQSPRLAIADSLGVIDGECQVVDEESDDSSGDGQGPASATIEAPKQPTPPCEPSKLVAAETLDQVFGRFIERLAQTKSVAEAGKVYDAFFAPDSAHKWTPEHEAAGAKARTEHNELVRPK